MPADNPVLGGCVLSAVRAIGEPEPTASTRSVAEGMQGSLLTQRNSEQMVGDGACTCFRAGVGRRSFETLAPRPKRASADGWRARLLSPRSAREQGADLRRRFRGSGGGGYAREAVACAFGGQSGGRVWQARR